MASVNFTSSRVFVVQDDGTHNFQDAERWGVLVPIFGKDLYADNVDSEIEQAMRTAKLHLADYRPGTDCICLVGSPLYVAAAMYTVGRYARGPVTVLKWDRQEHAYYAIELKVPH